MMRIRPFIFAIATLQLSAIGCHVQSQRLETANPKPAPFRSIRLPLATHPGMVIIADVNKDGNPDILIAGGNLSVFLGDGKGNFAAANGSPFPAGQNPADIATGDFNGDGNLDIAIANHAVRTVTVLIGNGK